MSSRTDKVKSVWIVRVLMALITCHLSLAASFSQGIPFLRNYMAADYHAHNMNFDIEVDDNGVVYVANFEGLLYFDQAEWHIIHTSDINRITVVRRTKDGAIYVGGYNYFGRIAHKDNGEIYLLRIGESGQFRGEVQEIWESDGELLFFVNDGNTYKVVGDKVSLKKKVSSSPLNMGLSDVISTDQIDNDNEVVVLENVTQTLSLENGMKVMVYKGDGLYIVDAAGKELYHITEANGLCSNNVVWVAYNGHGLLWGATENGVFSLAIPSAFSRFTSKEGLTGEVLSIVEYQNTFFVGTTNGLFRKKGSVFEEVPGIKHACWKLEICNTGMLAATANGIYLIGHNGTLRQLTTESATTLMVDGPQFYSGEMTGVFLTQIVSGERKKVCSLEKVTKIIKDGQGTIWMQNLYGEVWNKQTGSSSFKPYREGNANEAITLVPLGDKVEVVSADATKPFPYPQFSYEDKEGTTWLTNNEGKLLYRWKDGKPKEDMIRLLYPFHNQSVRSMYYDDGKVWIGGDNTLWVIDTRMDDPILSTKARILVRSVTLGGDSILWGGFGVMPDYLPQLSSSGRQLCFTYTVDYAPLVGNTMYRYRLNNGNWSAWEYDQDVEFINLPYGSYTLTVQALLTTGELSETASISFSKAYPFYMRWYMLVLYLILASLLVYALVRYRLHRLKLVNERLEKVVQERTAEVVKQKDEIEEKSRSLETALRELGEAQHELIRQEKMATAGKLTKGLIDRILNPINYINNFSKLSCGLIKDVRANIEDEKDNMSEDNYEDTVDVLEMLTQNLEKVEQHGLNTSRTLKAMEEILKDRSGGKIEMDVVTILKQDNDMLLNYFAENIDKYSIGINFNLPDREVLMIGNPELLSMTFMSVFGNSLYALEKKALRTQYKPELNITLETADKMMSIVVHDNGIGIESTILNKIFDPFFTTKTTGEAAGIGLYLTHEIILNHGGNITVQSEKDKYTAVTITLPILQNN